MFNRRHSAEALGRLHATFELNHARLVRLLPRSVPVGGERRYQLAFGEVQIALVERAAYSDVVAINLAQPGPRWMRPITLQLRRYHDANMSEVIDWCGQRTVPWQLVERPAELARDEKWQWNAFLAELLAELARSGRRLAATDSL